MAVPPSIFPLNYTLTVTGDCQNISAGAISIQATGGTPPYSYIWDTPLSSTCVLSYEPCLLTGLPGGNYGVRINDSTLPINNEFIVNVPVSSGICTSIIATQNTTCGNYNGAVTGTSTSFYSSTEYYLFDSTNQILQSATTNVDTVIFTNLSAGTYYLMALDLGGCTGKTNSFIIENSYPLSFGLYTVPNSSCAPLGYSIGKIYVTGTTGTPPYSYYWSNSETGSTITGLTSGIYSVTVTDALGCSNTQSTNLEDVSPLGFINFTATPPSCLLADGEITINITGGTAPYYYSASTGDVTISYQQNWTITGLSSGFYSFVVTDAGLCQILEGTSISTPQSIGSVTVNTTNSTCSSTNGSISINVSQGLPPFNYTLVYPDSSSQTVVLNSPNYLFSNLYSGTYEVIVSDQGSCTFTQTVYVIAENLYTISTSVTGTTCAQTNGSVYVEMTTGGTAPYTYSIDSIPFLIDVAFTSTTLSDLSSGHHVVSVTDANGCTQTENIIIPYSNPVQFSLFTTDCGNGSDGTITAFISSGQPPFTYIWSDNISGNPQQITVSGLTGGTYSLIISDKNGCSATQSTTISCKSSVGGYYNFLVGSQDLTVTTESQLGLTQMLNDGYQDLTDGNPSCILNSAQYIAIVDVQPKGLSASTIFYTGTSLNDVPAENLWINAIENLLISIPGVDSVVVNPNNNQLIIKKSLTNNYLDNQTINIDLAIEYDISC